MNHLILTLENNFILDPEFSGGKGANLAQLTREGLNVPPFFILSSLLYEHIIKINRIDQFIKEATSKKSLKNFKQVQSEILAAEIPDSIINQINCSFKNLIQNITQKKVAVRSSALAEDLEEHSFAGQLESYLDIQDENQLLESIKKCWASLWNDRVYSYHSKDRTQFLPQPMAVIVQQMIPVKISGICFTIDPTNDKREFILVEAHKGSGPEIVGGNVNPVQYRIDRKILGNCADNHTRKQSELLSKEQLNELAQTCLKIEATFSSPQDIEWGLFQDKFYIFQSRPITTAGKTSTLSKEKLWSKYFFGERFPQPVSPLGWSILKPLIEKNAFREPLIFLGFHSLARSRITKCFCGRPYAKLEIFQALHSFFPAAYVSLDKRKLFYAEPVSLRQSMVKIFHNIIPFLKSLFSTTDWIPPVHLRNWKRFINYYFTKIQSLNQVDLQILPDNQLWQMNLGAEQLSDRLLKLHRWSITFAELIYHFISYLVQKWLPQWDAEKTVIELHRGLPGNKTVEMNIELWNLSRDITDSVRWNSFFEKFGHRSTSLDISIPTFAEQTDYLMQNVQQFASPPSGSSPQEKQKFFKQQRMDCCQTVSQNLSAGRCGYLKTKLFKILLNWSEQFILLRENQRYYWHYALTINRKFFLELGRRFLDFGWLENSEHIFFLTRNEIKNVIFSKKFISKIKITNRLQQHQQWQKFQPPALIDESNPIQTNKVIIGKKLTGIAAGPGVATGKARILMTLQEMSQIQQGEILVVPTTDPGWTPLFGIIAGLVMEVGGVLSHGSIVAREFGVPAVTSVESATSTITTGAQITIDGNNGVIWIHESNLK